MANRTPWDKEEALILLDALINILNGKITRKEAVCAVSAKLRYRAIQHGMTIDDKFRNTNGIILQMSIMEYVFTEKKQGLKKSSVPKSFREAIDLYHNDYKTYEKLLEEAKAVSEIKSVQEQYVTWISSKVSAAQLSELYIVYADIESFCLKRNVLKRKLFETTDLSEIKRVIHTVESNKVFRFTYKRSLSKMSSAIRFYYNFVKEHPELCGQEKIETKEYHEKKMSSPSEKHQEIRADSIEEKSEIKSVTSKRANTAVAGNFYKWLLEEQHMAESTCRGYVSAIRGAERFAIEHGYSSTKLLDVDVSIAENTANELFRSKEFVEYNTTQHNRFRVAITKLLAYLGSEYNIGKIEHTKMTKRIPNEEIDADCKPYIDVAVKYFPRGYRMKSPLDYKRFSRYYEQATGKEVALGQEQIEHLLQKNGILYDERIYMAETMLSDEMKEEVFTYINQCFEDGKKTIYYQALFQEFSEEFLDYNIYNANMLKEYLSHTVRNEYVIGRNYMSKERYTENDPLEEIRKCLKEHIFPMDVKDLCKTLSHIPSSKIEQVLSMNEEFARNSKGEYFHSDSLTITAEELNDIAGLIEESIRIQEFISGNELFEAIRAKYPYMIEQNTAFSALGWRNALKYKLGDKFSFTGNIISAAGSYLTMSDCFENFSKTHDTFTMDELMQFATSLDTVIYFDSLYKQAVRISKNEFVAKRDCYFKTKETDAILDCYCTEDYLPLLKVREFGIFPDAFSPWNIYLLEQYVAFYSEKYMLLHTNFNRDCAVGAIVRKNCNYKTFDDLLTNVLARSNVPLQKTEALDYLVDNGYIARRSSKNIETLLLNAKAIRNRKEN